MSAHRILLVLNNCLSQSNANGRTMLRLLSGIPSDNVFQIYTYSEAADAALCGATMRITNRDAVISYFKKPACVLSGRGDTANTSPSSPGGTKNAFTMLLRDIVWDNSPRVRRMALDWAKSLRPDLILLQVGDASLQIGIALYLARKLNIPLITYNTEDYYFKKHDYMRRTERPGLTYRLFHRRFCATFDRLMKEKPVCLYNCTGLKERYDRAFGNNGAVIYCGSDFERVERVREDGLILYAGNLGVGRHATLISLARELRNIDPSLRIDVFGDATADVAQELRSSPGICYHGIVSYEQVKRNIRLSRLLIHVESFDPFTAMDARYAFSTKIADYMMSGVPVFCCGPSGSEGIAYMADHDAAFIADDPERCAGPLKEALFDISRRMEVSENALRLACKNHAIESIQKQFENIIDAVPLKEK